MKVSIELDTTELKTEHQKIGLKLLLGTIGNGARLETLGFVKETKAAADRLFPVRKHKRQYRSGMKGRTLRAAVEDTLKKIDKPLGIKDIAKTLKLSYGGTAIILRELKKRHIVEYSSTRPRLYFYRGGKNGSM